MGVYISESGFSKPAEKILLQNNIIFGTTDQLIHKKDMTNSHVDSKTKKKETKPTKTKAAKKKTTSKAKTTKKTKAKASKKKKTA